MVKTNFIIVPIFVFFVLVIPDVGGAFGLQYTNYTRDKYQIQFQYPSDWLVQEKPHRFEEGSEIDLSNNKIGSGEIAINFYNDLLEGFGTTDFDLAFADFYNGRATDSFDYEYATVKSPSFLNVDDQKTGTFLMMFKQRDETTLLLLKSSIGLHLWLIMATSLNTCQLQRILILPITLRFVIALLNR